MSMDLTIYENQNTSVSVNTQIEQSRAMQQVQAQVLMAKQFPRNSLQAISRVLDSCKRPAFAQAALFSYPRGGQTVIGPSIRLAEALAASYGNLDYGIRFLEQTEDKTVVEAYCWDLETNNRRIMTFDVPHFVQLKGGAKKILTDPRDIYEIAANMGARRLRQCILGLIPADFVDAAREQIKKTLADKSVKPLQDRMKDMIEAFKRVGVTVEMLQNKLGHNMETLTDDELLELTSIFNSLKDGDGKRSDFFDMKGSGALAPGEDVEAPKDLSSKLRSFKKDAPKAEP